MKKISFKNKFGYALGDVANSLTFAMSSSFLLAFYTDVLGITAAAAGTLFLVVRIWDAFMDPSMGILTDYLFKRKVLKNKGNTKKIEKFRPFLLKGSWPVVVASILMFYAPSGFSTAQSLIWAYATYTLYGTAYAFINIPYGSLSAVMTQDPIERSALSVARGVGGMVANVLPRVLVPLVLVKFSGDLAKGYLVSMIVFGIMAVAAYVISYFTVEENVEQKIVENKGEEAKGSFGQLFKNRPFIGLCLASLGMIFGLMVNMAMLVYYFRDNLNALSLLAITGVTTLIPTIIVAPIATKFVGKYGVKKTVSISSLLSAVVWGVLMLFHDNAYIYIGVSLVATIFMTVPNMLVWGMVSDCIDYNQYIGGRRQEGVIYGSYSFIRKLGQAIAGFLSGLGLTLIGYDAASKAQSAYTLFGIKFLTIGLPAVGMFIAFLGFQYIWNITPEKQKEISEAISK